MPCHQSLQSKLADCDTVAIISLFDKGRLIMCGRELQLSRYRLQLNHPSHHALKVTATNQSAHPTKPALKRSFREGRPPLAVEGITDLTSLVLPAQTSLRSNFTRAPHELHCESIESLSCHPERRAKPAVEPEGRCIASGSKEHYQRLAVAKGELYRSPRSCSVTPRTAPRFDSARAPLRMTRVGAMK